MLVGLHLALIAEDTVSKLEKEFKEVRKKINAKIKEAAKALSEANKIAKDAGIDYLTTTPPWMYNEYSEEEMEALRDKLGHYNDPTSVSFRELFSALEESGWTPSSMRC